MLDVPSFLNKSSCYKWMFWRRRRHLVCFLAFFGFFNVYLLRVNLNVAIVAMNSRSNVTLDNGTVILVQDFNWDSKMQGVVLGSFFYGYICTQVLGGWLGQRFGGSGVFGMGIFVTAFLTTLSPFLARTNVYLLVAARIIEGFFEGGTYPSIQALWARWAPPQERTFMVAVAFSGIPVGTVVGLQVSGIIGSTLGWPAIFYITGLFGMMWFAIWRFIVRDCPEEDSHISPEELKYINDSIGDVHIGEKHVKYPWKKIITSMPVWAVVVANFCETWGHNTILTQLPTFMKDVFDYNLAKAGIITSLPYIMMGVTMQFCGGLSDRLKNKNVLSTTQVRKLFICGAFLCQAAFLLLAGRSQSPLGVVLSLIVSVGMESFALASYYVNTLDLAPHQAGVLYGISNTAGSLAGALSPLVSGFVVTDKSAEQWQVIFYISSSLFLSGALFYGVFGSGEKQSWAVQENRTQPNVAEAKNESGYYNSAISDDHM